MQKINLSPTPQHAPLQHYRARMQQSIYWSKFHRHAPIYLPSAHIPSHMYKMSSDIQTPPRMQSPCRVWSMDPGHVRLLVPQQLLCDARGAQPLLVLIPLATLEVARYLLWPHNRFLRLCSLAHEGMPNFVTLELRIPSSIHCIALLSNNACTSNWLCLIKYDTHYWTSHPPFSPSISIIPTCTPTSKMECSSIWNWSGGCNNNDLGSCM